MSGRGWEILTGEYGRGGIGDYTALLARALAEAGETVRVWTPAAAPEVEAAAGVEVRAVGGFGRAGLRALDRAMDGGGRRLLVQYAPQAFGARGMNVRFCRWVAGRARAGDEVRVTFHEPYYPFGWRAPHRNLLAVVNRGMAMLLLRAASRAYVSTPAWERRLRRWAPAGRPPFTWLPVPSTIPRVTDPARVAALRAAHAPEGAALLAHFGTYGGGVAPLLADTLGTLLRGRPDARVLLLGRGGESFARILATAAPAAAARVHATGALAADDVSLHLQAADAALQPYPDGASTRRTTLMACLANGVPTVTSGGASTEALWHRAPVVLAERPEAGLLAACAAGLLADPGRRAALAAAGPVFHARRFGMEATVRTLLQDPEGA